MSFLWSILWEILKWTAILGGSFLLISFLIVLFHPIYVTLKGRASVRGQRGEIKLSYLFNLLKIRFVASAKSQDMLLEFCGLKIRKGEAGKVGEEAGKVGEEAGEGKEEVGKGREEGEESRGKEPLTIEEDAPSADEPFVVDEATYIKEPFVPAEEYIVKQETHVEGSIDSEQPLTTDEYLANDEAFAEEPFEEKTVEPPMEEVQNKTQGQEIREKLRKFKKDFNRRYDDLRKKLRILRQKWNSLYPIAKRFWNRGKKGFKFDAANLRIHYSLDEPYLTGMLCGYLAPTIGFAKEHGLEFEPVPVFSEEPAFGIHTKASWCVIIRPWLLIWSITCLLFEKNLYKEIFWLYRHKKGAKKS